MDAVRVEESVPAGVVESLVVHLDEMREAFFPGELARVAVSFASRNRRNRGEHRRAESGCGLRWWNVNLNPVHFQRPLFAVLATLLHELVHAWQEERGTGAKPPHHNREFIERCERLGIPTDGKGHDLGVRHGSPFHEYCRAHQVPFPPAPGANGEDEPPPLLPEPPVKPKGSRLRKWICSCEDPVAIRVARADLDASCNRCGKAFRPA